MLESKTAWAVKLSHNPKFPWINFFIFNSVFYKIVYKIFIIKVKNAGQNFGCAQDKNKQNTKEYDNIK